MTVATGGSGPLSDAAAVALDTARAGFPEPTLLPHLARSLAIRDFPVLLDAVEWVGNGRDGLPPWPRLKAATCAIVSHRLNEAADKDIAATLAPGHKELFSHLDVPVLDTAVHMLTPEGESWYEEERAERLCRLAARHPDHAGGVLVDLASAALFDLAPERAITPSAWFLPLTDGAERRGIIDAWCKSDWRDLSATAALFAFANDSERELLTPGFLDYLADHASPEDTAAALATVFPTLADSMRAQALEQLSFALFRVATRVPLWWLALVWSRTSAMEVSSDLDLSVVGPAWQDSLEPLGPLPPESAYSDVLRAHPGATAWMTADGYPGISTESAESFVSATSSRWGAHLASAAPARPAPAPAPPRSPASKPPPFWRRRRGSSNGGAESAAPPSPAPLGSRTSKPPPFWRRRRGSSNGGAESAPPPGLGSILGRIFRARSRHSGGSDSVMRGPPPEAPPESLPDRRLQADVALANKAGKRKSHILTAGFVAGAKHVVEISVGRGASLQLAVGFMEPAFEKSSEVESLQLRLLYDGGVSGGTIDLPRDTALDSTVWPASLEVPADADNIEATIVVLHKSRVLQAAKLWGPVVSSLNAATGDDREIQFDVIADVHELKNLEARGTFDASFMTDGTSGAAFSGDSYRVQDLRGIDKTIKKMTDRLFKSTESVVMAGGSGDPARHEALLVYLAVHGKALHSTLIKPRLSTLDEAKRIQIVNAGESPILPLEFVYAGPSPAHSARLCDGWREALAQGICPTCTPPSDGVRADKICPLNFWALSKVIERHAPGEPRPDGYDYALETCVPGKRDRLTPLKHALFAASDNVPEDLVEATLEDLRSIDSTCDEALTWADWMTGVAKTSPTLLVSMPHNALDPVLDIPTLEIGRGSDLRAGEVTRAHVCRDDADIGPVVLLLGCQTAQSGPLPYHTFVREFRDNGAAIVIGTLATVLGEHAAPVVRVILGELARPTDPNESTFGDLLLRMRRQMFAQGILIALAVAAFGDAEWSLAPPGD